MNTPIQIPLKKGMIGTLMKFLNKNLGRFSDVNRSEFYAAARFTLPVNSASEAYEH